MTSSYPLHETGMRTGWLYNYHNTAQEVEGDKEGGKEATSASALNLLFQDLDGVCFEAILKYNPYFLVAAAEGHERRLSSASGAPLGSSWFSRLPPSRRRTLTSSTTSADARRRTSR